MSLNSKLKLIRKIDFLKISKNETGTYPLQSIIESITSDQEKSLIMEKYKNYFKELSLDKYGNHIIEKSLFNLDFNRMIVFYDIIKDNFLKFACNPFGIKIIKIYAKKIISNKLYFDNFESLVFTNLDKLINDEFGNYLIQVVIEYWNKSYSWKIVQLYENNLIDLSISKYSSNVIEKLIVILETVSLISYLNRTLLK